METNTIFSELPIFTNKNNESLDVIEIMNKKKITSVTIAYLSKEKKVSVGGIRGLFGAKKVEQNEKELIIFDPKGITLYFTKGIPSVSIRFWDKNQFDKIADKDYDEKTLWKRYVLNLIHPYQINFHIGNLNNVNWEENKQ
ncbi:MAG: hypothetical protein ACJA2Z_000356 [Candidatus Paceibacteria bacterium]|jgi:hypothetical protein